MKIEIGPSKQLATRDTLVVASDGLFDNVSTDRIAQLTRTAAVADVAAKLVAAVDHVITEAAVGKPDDLAVIVFRPATT